MSTEQRSGDGLASSQDRRVLIAVLAKVSFYYAALFSLVFALLTAFPNLITMLPVGGVDQLSSGAELEIMQLEDAMLSGDFDEEVEDAYTAIESPPSCCSMMPATCFSRCWAPCY